MSDGALQRQDRRQPMRVRGEARELILAQQYAGGDPVQEQTATGAEA
jgi:hypothetical protein